MKNILVPIIIIISLFILSFLPAGKVTVFMIGDSTMADKPTEDNPERGWGQMFPLFFDTTIVIENHAKNGRSTKTFISENRWQKVFEKLKPGDYVIIQFGHNDQSKEKIERYTSPEDYRKSLIKFVNETLEKKGKPILCTPIVRRRFDEKGNFYDTHGVYPDIVREVAKEFNVPLIDMHKQSEELLCESGPDSSKKLFLWIEPGVYKLLPQGKKDNTHFSEFGALKMAELAVEEIKKLNLDLKNYLKK